MVNNISTANPADASQHVMTDMVEAITAIEMETRDGGQWTREEINECARKALARGWSADDIIAHAERLGGEQLLRIIAAELNKRFKHSRTKGAA